MLNYYKYPETCTENRIEREQFYPGLELKPGPVALRASALSTTLSRTSTDP